MKRRPFTTLQRSSMRKIPHTHEYAPHPRVPGLHFCRVCGFAIKLTASEIARLDANGNLSAL